MWVEGMILATIVWLLVTEIFAIKLDSLYVSLFTLLGISVFEYYQCGSLLQPMIGLCLLQACLFVYTSSYLRQCALHTTSYYQYYYLLNFFSLLGMQLLLHSQNMLALYLGLELVILPQLVLLALEKQAPAALEIAFKVFVLNIVGSGLLLYGLSLLYAFTGTLDLSGNITNMLHQLSLPSSLLAWMLAFIIGGIAFKLGLAPLHMWLVELYHGGGVVVASFIATMGKVAAFLVAYKLLYLALGVWQPLWQNWALLLGGLSILWGSIMGCWQSNLRRLLGYSAVVHMGFIMVALSVLPETGVEIAFFYLASYICTVLGVFAVLLLAGKSAGQEILQIQQLTGLMRQSPYLSMALVLLLLSLAGLPPLLGFYAKFRVLNLLILSEQYLLTAVILISGVLAASYYIRIIQVICFNSSQSTISLYNNTFLAQTIYALQLGVFLGLSILPTLLDIWH
jgi:NADH-quinone oxidoreductase subunit N